ncbi:PAS domain-containing protein [Halorubrum sp. N11]|uniref:PAS domain-containing protein n=1 Tax=Halorubrum sp. N11 TaxID=3402276 RepID=UPI003EB7AE40
MSSATLTVTAARSRLDEITRQDVSAQQKVSDALDLGTEYLSADFGYLAVTDEQFDYWDPIVSTDVPDGIPDHVPRDLSTTYCRRTAEADEQVALHDLPAQGLTDDPGYQTFGCHCYLGTPLMIDGTRRGTVCFVSEEPRSTSFDDVELLFADLLARVLGYEVQRDWEERKLRNQTNLTTVLNRVLRHNLRNDMTVIRGHTQAMADQLESDTHSDLILENVDQLIELGDKARDLESVIDQTAPREPTDLSRLAACVAGTVEENAPAAAISVDATEEVVTPVRPSFEQALREVLENAVKHGGESPTVSVGIEQTPTAVSIRVTDDGPGLPSQEREVLENEAETPLVHGSGLGLWLVHWIVTTHGGTVESTVTGRGTTMTVSIPRAPESSAEASTGSSGGASVGSSGKPSVESFGTPSSTDRDPIPELTRARDQYRAAFKESNDAMVITDDDGRIIDANSTAAEIYGVDREALLGQSVPEFLPDEFDFATAWESFMASGNTRDTMTIFDSDGHERMLEYAGTADIVPGQHLLVSHDITDRVERQAELRMKTRAMDNAPIGITISDPSADDNPLIYANDQFCDQSGYEKSEVLGRNCRYPQGEGTDPEAVDRIRRAIRDQEPVTETLRNYRKSGTMFWNRLTVAPVKDEQGRLKNYVGFQEDVTESVERDQAMAKLMENVTLPASIDLENDREERGDA